MKKPPGEEIPGGLPSTQERFRSGVCFKDSFEIGQVKARRPGAVRAAFEDCSAKRPEGRTGWAKSAGFGVSAAPIRRGRVRFRVRFPNIVL
jgi:hypothetical protein